MIRDYWTEDKASIMQMLKQGIKVVDPEDHEFLFRKENKILVFELERVGMVGFCSFGLWGVKKENGKFMNYVVPKYRGRKIGTALYNATIDYAKSLNLHTMETIFRADVNSASDYYAARGYHKWYGQHVMKYSGGEQPISNMDIVPYEDCFFEQYIDGIRNSFYEMRRINDFKPYYCIDYSEKERKDLLEDKDNIFLLLKEGKLVASAAVHTMMTDVLGPVFVIPSAQGKGYGKAITQFAINEARRRGMADITLEVVEWNQRAINLYLNLGFEIIQTTDSYRKD